MRKISLVEQFLYVDTFPLKQSLVNLEKVKFNAMLNYWGDHRQTNNENSFLYDYYNLTQDKNITWILDYVKDKHDLESKRNLINPQSRLLIQGKDESINYHNHIDEYDLINSPSISGIYTISCGENPVYFKVKYGAGRKQEFEHLIPLKENQLIVFNSELFHCFTKNENKKHIINICFTFNYDSL